MSNTSKITAALTGLSILATLAAPALAVDATTSSAVKRNALQKAISIREKTDEKIATIQDKIASRAASLKARLEQFKDQKKAAIAERVNINLNKINQNQTAQMQKHLGVISNVLDKLEARVNQGTPDVKDPATARAAIADARSAIASASAAVTEQTQKDYTITVTSEAKVRTDAQVQRQQLHGDLKAVRQQVITAKQSVGNAIRTAKAGKPEISIPAKEGTVSGQQ
ncbi:hypothetical protein HYS95_01660 [Candidatus Daviesbacteria bacterium]|nr:hypothetical protein [Candidatus Daviesbacteria bacterium]